MLVNAASNLCRVKNTWDMETAFLLPRSEKHLHLNNPMDARLQKLHGEMAGNSNHLRSIQISTKYSVRHSVSCLERNFFKIICRPECSPVAEVHLNSVPSSVLFACARCKQAMIYVCKCLCAYVHVSSAGI